LTLFTGLRLTNTTEFLCDIQETGGHGIGEAFGLAGFTNLDVVRNPALSKAPYIARLIYHQIIPLGANTVPQLRGPYSLFPRLPERRIEIRFGKFSLADFFDLNTYGSDQNFQFMNWTIDNNGAWDYAADTRGYTYAAMIEYDSPHWSLRFAEALMPKAANGIHLDADLSRARSETQSSSFVATPSATSRVSCAFSASSITPTWASTARPLTISWPAARPLLKSPLTRSKPP